MRNCAVAPHRHAAAEAEELERLREEIALLEADRGTPRRLRSLREKLERLEAAHAAIPYIDPIDMRYRRFEPSRGRSRRRSCSA